MQVRGNGQEVNKPPRAAQWFLTPFSLPQPATRREKVPDTFIWSGLLQELRQSHHAPRNGS
jgi:hypothetical protein